MLSVDMSPETNRKKKREIGLTKLHYSCRHFSEGEALLLVPLFCNWAAFISIFLKAFVL